MSREIPEPVRAAAGLAATVVDEVRKLPETIPGLPVRAIGLAMQAALKLQQEYAGLVARGDELFTGLRGEDEPGLATFDDDVDAAPAPAATPPGFRDSAFDRTEVPPVDAIGDTEQVERGLEDLEDAALEDAALEDMALEDVAIEELVDASPATDTPGGTDGDAGAIENALLESEAAAAGQDDAGADTPTLVDVADGERGLGTVEAVVTEEGVVTPEPAGDDAPTGTATDEGGTPVAAVTDEVGGEATDEATATTPAPAAPASEPVNGYDGFTIAQLRGRLRGYAIGTVEQLLAYEQANRAREPYLRMLRNRLERLTADAVASSPLAPRGAAADA